MKFLAIMALGILILIALVMVLLRGCAPKRGQSPRGGAGRGQAPRGGSRPPQQGPDMKFLAIMALGILILIALVMVLLRGCAPKPEAVDSASSTPSAQKADSKDTSEDSTDVDEGAPRGGSRQPQQGPDMNFLAIMALGILILIALVMVLLRGCAPKPEAVDSASSTPSAQKADSKDTSEDSTDVDERTDSSTDEGDDSDEPSSSKDKADKSSKDVEPKETIVKVKVKETVAADRLRDTSASKDALQQVIAFRRDHDYGQPLQFTNYR